MFPIELFCVKTNPAKSARNLGVMFNKTFIFRSHISVVCSSYFYHMRDLRRIRCHLDLDTAKLLATALVSSRLDYCNSLLYGIANIDLTRLQRVQNRLARPVTKSPPFTRSVPLLRSLHWLPVWFRTLSRSICWPPKPWVKNSLFLFNPCLTHHFHPVHWDQTMIIVCQSLGSRPTQVWWAFHSCELSLWSNLLLSVRSASSVATFKKYLSTYLFDLTFSQ